jgi:hypothetical protein
MGPDLFSYQPPKRYPDAPAARTVDTSQEAADAIAPHLNELQTRVLQAIDDRGRWGATPEEIVEATGIPLLTVRPRTSELQKKAMIRDTGLRRKNRAGKNTIVWGVA